MLHARKVVPIIRKEHNVPKEGLLEFEGLVTEILPDARYRVRLDNGHQLVAYTAGRMKRNRIKTLAGDRVTVEVSLSPQGRTRRIAEPSAAASPVSAAMTGRRHICCSPRHEGHASGPRASVAAIGALS